MLRIMKKERHELVKCLAREDATACKHGPLANVKQSRTLSPPLAFSEGTSTAVHITVQYFFMYSAVPPPPVGQA